MVDGRTCKKGAGRNEKWFREVVRLWWSVRYGCQERRRSDVSFGGGTDRQNGGTGQVDSLKRTKKGIRNGRGGKVEIERDE